MWDSNPDWSGHLEQMWFRGAHGDVGGHLGDFAQGRPLSNIPLVWMLENLETCGLSLPAGWREQFPQDVSAPSVGSWRAWGKMFLSRRRRIILGTPSETVHPTVMPDEGTILPPSADKRAASPSANSVVPK